MDPRMLDYYNRELQHVREMGSEFAREYPKIAGRLGMEGFDCADPYVERLLEGFAFLAARVRLKVDAQFPEFTRHLLEMVYPQFLAPTPSMAVVQFKPDLDEADLGEGYTIPRDTSLRSPLAKGEATSCEFRTGHPVTMWPILIEEAAYFSSTGAVGTLGIPDVPGAKAALRLRLRTAGDVQFAALNMDSLPLYLQGPDDFAMRLYEQIAGKAIAVVVQPRQRTAGSSGGGVVIPARDGLQALGFSDEEALIPCDRRNFHGYRLLTEYFAFPERYMFVELRNLLRGLKNCDTDAVDIVILLGSADSSLERVVDKNHFGLFCTPAINLFPRRADRITLNDRDWEYHVLADRTRPMDFEVYSIAEATGFGVGGDKIREFRPLYSSVDRGGSAEDISYYTVQRRARMLSARQKRRGARSSYIGSEVYLTLVDPEGGTFPRDLRQIALRTYCTNRDLPLHMPVGQGSTDFLVESGAPVDVVRVVAGPTRPAPSIAHGRSAWALISQLSLNYLSLLDHDASEGAAALRQLLSLYADVTATHLSRQIDGVRSVTGRGVIRRLPLRGPITFGRGLEITVECDEAAFEGVGVFLIASVLDRFFARYVSMNSFTETALRTIQRGEVMRWPARTGQRQTL